MERTTNVAISNTVLADNQATLARLATYQEQLSSGKRINRISDDPVAANSAMRYRAQSLNVDKYSANIDSGTALMTSADSALSNVSTLLDQAKLLAVQGTNASQDASSRKTLATSVNSLLSNLVDLGNTEQNGRFIFAGTATQTQPFALSADKSSVTYQGNLDSYDTQIGPSTTVTINQDGHSLFQGQVDVFKTLINLRDALNANDPQLISGELSNIDTAASHINDLHGALGGREQRLTLAQNQLTATKTNLTDLISKTEDVDFPKVISDYQLAQTALEAGLQVGAKIIKPTLLDYLS